MRDVVIVSGVRTPLGSFGGSLKDVTAVDMGALVIKESLRSAGLRPEIHDYKSEIVPAKLRKHIRFELKKFAYKYKPGLQAVNVDEVIMGCVLQSGLGQNPARQSAVGAGIPKKIPSYTINKVCGSGMKSVTNGAESIMLGRNEIVIAGGMENMSQAPFALKKFRWGDKMELTGKGDIHDLMVFDGLMDIFNECHMGLTAESIADLYKVSREDQDKLALLSHKRALGAITGGDFIDEIVPVEIKGKKDTRIVELDERPTNYSMEELQEMHPAFKNKGSITAGNSAGINDGAAALLLMSAEKAEELGLEPLARIRAYAAEGIEPMYMGLGPVPAIRRVLKLAGMKLEDMDMIEINEAFAAQALACYRELGIDDEFPNQFGSGISLGHPIGCTGARMIVTAIHQMKRRNFKTGLVSMCIGGGMGMAMVLEREMK